MPEGLTGAAIGDFAKGLWTIFPDFSLDLKSIGDMGGELITLEWVAHGTNTAAFPDGTPATGRKVTFLELFITTKLWNDWQTAAHRALDESLKRLRIWSMGRL